MALHVPKAPGFGQMLKDGAKHYSGLDEAVYSNIDACRELAKTTRSALGPHGQNKMVINHLEKLFVTNDAATILRELEVQHPAAKMLVLASHQQEQEVGDGTNFVLVFAGELLHNAETLLKMGLSVTEVTEGYELASKKALELLPDLVCKEQKDLRNKAGVTECIRASIMSKQYGNEDFLADLIASACISVLPQKINFNVDNIRVSKILGAGVHQSQVVQGMVFKRAVEGDIIKAAKCKIAVYTCPLDNMQTETKGTVLIKTAEELMDFSKGEENQMEEQIKGIADTGCKVIVSGGKVGELALHYCNKYGLMVVRLMSKFDLRRLCKSIGATALPRITPPTAEEQEKEESAIATIVIRGSTDNILDDIERAIDDGVNTFKALTKGLPGLEQYAVCKFAESLEVIPRAMAENAGAKATEVLSKLYAAHHEGKKNYGVDIEVHTGGVKDAKESGVLDLYLNKFWAIKFATAAACTVLRVDQIIMAKPAGGPKAKENKNWDDD
ncbi:hypothetical protein KUTeg_007216 [Tegillarca granosa]|uniref:T-complex protein 1 subunit theta n=1 Tax=Tegillarca granosa TaxID=220873 RepID=A0ABQ9FCM5_TEGGR|nr:hypothetical protein KUTeg_007216 [Tegillarca granosa]